MEKKDSPKLLYLSRAQVQSLNLPYNEVCDCVTQSFVARGLGKTEMPPKWGLYPKDSALMHAMPALVRGESHTIAGLKWLTSFGENAAKKLPTIQGLVVVNDADTGTPLSIMDCAVITERRTAAAGVVTAKALMHADATTMCIIGVGRVGTQHLVASCDMLPMIKKYYLYDQYLPAAEAAAKLAKQAGKEAVVAKSIEEAVKEADVILTAASMTKEKKPSIRLEWLKSRVAMIAQDYDATFQAECMAGADEYLVDDKEQYTYTMKTGMYFAGFPEKPCADMGEVLAGKYKVKPESKRRGAVLQGIATHDVVTADRVYQKAKEQGVGTWLDI